MQSISKVPKLGFNNSIIKQELPYHTKRIWYPEQTPGCSSDYDDNPEKYNKDFFTEQQYSTDHFNDTCYSRYRESKPNRKPKTNTANHLRYPCSPMQQ